MKEVSPEYTSGIIAEVISSFIDLFLLPMLGLGLTSDD